MIIKTFVREFSPNNIAQMMSYNFSEKKILVSCASLY